MERILSCAQTGHSSRRGRTALAALFVAAVFASGEASAQLPQTRLYSVFPAGGKAGATFEFKIANGVDLDEVDGLIFSHAGISAKQKMQDVAGKQQPVVNTFDVSIAGNVPPGIYEVRAKGLFGVSNPRAFVVGDRDEILEIEPNNDFEKAGEIQTQTVVNGQLNGGADVDYFKFNGQKGQRIVVRCLAARIDSKAMATIEVYDARKRRLAYGRDQVRSDPLVDVTLPEDGEYFVKIFDFVYGGGADYVYRLSVGTQPYIDFVMPPSGVPGTTAKFTLFGRNLPGGKDAGLKIDGRPIEKVEVQIPIPKKEGTLDSMDNLGPVEAGIDGFSYSLSGPQGASNPVLIYYATDAVTIETEPNDEPAQSNRISVPAEFVGSLQAKGDIDHVQFDAKAKDVYYIEAYAQRSGSSADVYFTLDQITVAADGTETSRRLTTQDDNPTNLAANIFDTITDDPVFRFQVPADGTYRISLRDRYYEARGNPALVYRLAIRKEQPDFRVVALPVQPIVNNQRTASTWEASLRKGDNYPVDVMAFRQDGFEKPIEVWVEGLPKGVVAHPAVINEKATSATLVITAAEDAPEWAGEVKIMSKALIDDPAKARAIPEVQAVVKTAADNLAKALPPAEKAAQDLAKADEQLQAAKTAAEQKTDDAGLKSKFEAAQKARDAAADAAQKANDAKAAAEKVLAEAQAAEQKAVKDHQASIRTVTREARAATISWPTANNVPPIARLAKAFGLSVMKEAAPYEIRTLTEASRFEANQGRQILVPVKLIKRDGFDNNVTLAFVGAPNNVNITFENKTINKGKDEELLKISVNNNAVPGTYTVYLNSQAQVNHKRNPDLEERTKVAAEAAAQAVKDKDEALKKAAAELADATKKATDADTAFKAATTARTAAEKKKTDADAAVKKATDDKSKAETAAKQAEAAAKDAAEDAGKADAAKKAAEALAAADKALKDAEAAAAKAQEELAAATKTAADADAASKAAVEVRTKADADNKAADAAKKAADAAKTAADQSYNTAKTAAAPKSVNYSQPSPAIVIEVKPAPVQLAANIPGGGALQIGQKLDVKVTVNRQNGFTGPVTLTLPEVYGVTGLKAQPVEIPADQKEGVISIEAVAGATEGALPTVVVRGIMDFNGKAAVDVPVPLNVKK